jgi:hypothetical protein
VRDDVVVFVARYPTSTTIRSPTDTATVVIAWSRLEIPAAVVGKVRESTKLESRVPRTVSVLPAVTNAWMYSLRAAAGDPEDARAPMTQLMTPDRFPAATHPSETQRPR